MEEVYNISVSSAHISLDIFCAFFCAGSKSERQVYTAMVHDVSDVCLVDIVQTWHSSRGNMHQSCRE